jgi:hypothetical protein
VLGACDEAPKKNPFDAPPDAPKPVPTNTAPPPEVAPILEIDEVGPKIGSARAMLEQRDGPGELRSELAQHKKYIDGLSVSLRVARKAKPSWVALYLTELEKLGAKAVTVKTETRSEFPAELVLSPPGAASQAPACSVVGAVLEDRSTAIWKRSGGVAGRRGKGMAGPDLSMTADTIERYAKQCKDSTTFFFTAPDSVEWGLLYDLAASSARLEKAKFSVRVLLREATKPGAEISL